MIVTSKIHLRYSDTDQMGVIHHSMYAQYLEQSRTEYFRKLGHEYIDIEASGVIFPVYDIHITYHQSIRLGETIYVDTHIDKVTPVKIVFKHVFYTQGDTVKARASSTLVCVDKETFKLKKMPLVMKDLYKKIRQIIKNLDA